MSLHGPDPSYYADMERDAIERLRADKYDETVHERTFREYMERRASCRLPESQRLSEATRVGHCRMQGIDPYPDQPNIHRLPARPAIQHRKDAA